MCKGLFRYGSVVSVSACHAVGHGFGPQLGYTKGYHKNDTNSIPVWHAIIRLGVWQCSLTVNGQVVCGTVYGDKHYKDLLRL